MANTARTQGNYQDLLVRLEHKLDTVGKISFREKLLIVLLPLLVTGFALWLIHANAKKQLQMASAQLATAQQLETAKLLAQYSEMIHSEDKREARLAQLAFGSVPMSPEQRLEISEFLEKTNNSDAFVKLSQTGDAYGDTLSKLLESIFSEDKYERRRNYPHARYYIERNIDGLLLTGLFRWIKNDEFNITGRSNVLSILADLPAAKLKPYAYELNSALDDILTLEGRNPAYAIGPKTHGWINEIRRKL